ncbi:MAG: hypothetical protein ACREJC_05555, partial [Tepidisphaeraceae bacterium]
VIVVSTGPYARVKACERRTLTSYGDAAKATLRCSKQSKKKGVASLKSAPCFLLHGMPGSERLVGRCLQGKCGKPKEGDNALITRCRTGKKARRALIAERAHADRNRGIGPSKASRSGVFPRADLDKHLGGRRR